MSEAEILDRDRYINPPDPNYDDTPQLAGYVVVAADSFATYQAHKAMPRRFYLRQPAYMWVDRETGLWVPGGVETSSNDDVAGRVSGGPTGRPEFLCPDRRAEGEPEWPRPPLPVFIGRSAPLSSVLGSRILDFVEEWSGLTEAQIQRLCRESRRRLRDMLQTMIDSRLIQVRQGMHYLGLGGEIYVADRDGVHVNAVRARNRVEIEQDHRGVRPHRRHTRGRNATVVEMTEERLAVYGSWRTLHDIQGVTQIPPNAVLLADLRILPLPSDPLLDTPIETGAIPVYLEFERSARTPARLQRKLEPYFKSVRQGQRIWVVIVCETQHAADLFRSEIMSEQVETVRVKPAMVTTLSQVKEGLLKGPGSIWSVSGRPGEMR